MRSDKINNCWKICLDNLVKWWIRCLVMFLCLTVYKISSIIQSWSNPRRIIASWTKWIHTFLKGISSNVNVISWLGFELIYAGVVVEYVCNHATGTSTFCSVLYGCVDSRLTMSLVVRYDSSRNGVECLAVNCIWWLTSCLVYWFKWIHSIVEITPRSTQTRSGSIY